MTTLNGAFKGTLRKWPFKQKREPSDCARFPFVFA